MDLTTFPAHPVTAPLPRPPVVSAPGAMVVDLVSAADSHGWAWSARVDHAEVVTRVHARKRKHQQEHTVVSSLATEVGEFLRSLTSDAPITVRCFVPIVRTALISKLDPQLFALPDGLALGPAAAWADAAKRDLWTRLGEQEEQLRAGRTLYGASDGSMHPVYGNPAYAWVTEHGRFGIGQTKRNSRGDVLTAELTAIVEFAKNVPFDTFGKAVLFVDSLRAIEMFRDRDPRLWRLPDPRGVMLTIALLSSRRLELVWVRSHNGHPLNDLADRLALMRHRAIRMRLDQKTIHANAQGIIQQEIETLLATNWATAHAEAVKNYHRLLSARAASRTFTHQKESA
ncbi:ribonuclease HI [Microbacterium gorillae]|uniref:ribonuclease HI n=1 Tax=Microbacterium gorillae TaxID=1231063 RepID=UPI003D959ABF